MQDHLKEQSVSNKNLLPHQHRVEDIKQPPILHKEIKFDQIEAEPSEDNNCLESFSEFSELKSQSNSSRKNIVSIEEPNQIQINNLTNETIEDRKDEFETETEEEEEEEEIIDFEIFNKYSESGEMSLNGFSSFLRDSQILKEIDSQDSSLPINVNLLVEPDVDQLYLKALNYQMSWPLTPESKLLLH